MEAQQRGIGKELNRKFGSERCNDWTEEFNSLSIRLEQAAERSDELKDKSVEMI